MQQGRHSRSFLLGKLLKDDFFALFGLPARYEVDEAALDAAYRTVQSQAPGPFRQCGRCRAARGHAVGRACQRGLPDAAPAAQARDLSAASAGVDIQAESNTAMAPEFLMQQMEWREALQDAVDGARWISWIACCATCVRKSSNAMRRSARCLMQTITAPLARRHDS
jgi:molecular chaperone HscB